MSDSCRDKSVQPENFAFSPENLEKAKAFIGRYPKGRQASAVMALLDLAQRQEGWLPRAAMDHVAAMLDMARVRVYEVATFYSMYKLEPVGRYHLQICTNLPCMLRGSQEIVDAAEQELGVRLGESTQDGLFTLSEVECLGACANAPVIWIGDHYYEDLDTKTVLDLIRALKRGETPDPGSRKGRQGACPEGGPTSLADLKQGGGAGDAS